MSTNSTIRELRNARGWSQEKLGSVSGVHPVSLARYELGQNTPTLRNLQRIADAFGIGIGDIRLVHAQDATTSADGSVVSEARA